MREKLRLILKATRQHARNLAMYATVYKSSMLFLRLTSLDGKEAGAHTFLSGLIGGYVVFGRGYQSSVNQQIVIYVFARAMLALAKLTVQKETGFSKVVRTRVTKNAWPVFASLSWGVIMWTYRWYPDTIQPSLKSSMKYMYVYPSAHYLAGLLEAIYHARPEHHHSKVLTNTFYHADMWTRIIGIIFETYYYIINEASITVIFVL